MSALHSGKALVHYKDIGKFIPYAKKHMVNTSDVRKGELTLKVLWPEPDWVEWCDNGVDRRAAARMHQYYHSLRRKPRISFHSEVSNEMWADAYVTVVLWLKESFLLVRTLDDLEAIERSFKSFLRIPDIEGTPRLADIYAMFAAGRGEKRKFRTPFSLTSRATYMADLLPKLGWPYLIKHTKVKLFPVKMRNTETDEVDWMLCSISGRRYRWSTEDNSFQTEKEAIEALKRMLDVDTSIRVPRKVLDNIKSVDPKIGGIDPQRLLDEFGISALQYGNSLSQVERARFVDNTYYGLCHLADVMGVPRKWLGLAGPGGGVGIAFGARGSGGAVAHYEPGLNIINLTRYNGPGSLAHEWFHAFDARIATQCGLKGQLVSELSDRAIASSGNKIPMLKPFRTLQKTITSRSTNFYSNARCISSQKGMRNYWHKKSELLARAFEAFAQDKTDELSAKATDWLAFGTRDEDNSLRDKELNPYPVGDERTQFSKVFETQLSLIWWPSDPQYREDCS